MNLFYFCILIKPTMIHSKLANNISCVRHVSNAYLGTSQVSSPGWFEQLRFSIKCCSKVIKFDQCWFQILFMFYSIWCNGVSHYKCQQVSLEHHSHFVNYGSRHFKSVLYVSRYCTYAATVRCGSRWFPLCEWCFVKIHETQVKTY